MNLKKILRQKKTYIMLAGAYFAFILISLFVGIWYYSNMKDSVVENTLKYNESMIKLMKSNLDRELNEINMIDYYIEINDVTQKMLKDEEISEREKYNLMQLLNKLKTDPFLIEDICVYYEKEDLIISSRNVIKSNLYFETQCKMVGYTYETWKEKYLRQIRDREFYPAENISLSSTVNQNVIIYKRSLFPKKDTIQKVHILMTLKPDAIRENLKGIKLAGDSKGFIVDTEGNIILSTDESKLMYDRKKLTINEDVLYDDENEQVEIYEKSDSLNLIYISQMNKALILKDVNSFVKVGLVLVVLYILLGIVFLRFSGYMIYNPIKRIVKKIVRENDSESYNAYSEMEMISAKIDDLLNKEIKYIYQIEELNDYKKKTQLRSLLTGRDEIRKSELMNWQDEYFLVMLVRVLPESFNDDEDEQIIHLIKYGILNILQDLMDNFVKGEVIEMENNYIACIFNFEYENAGDIIENIQKMSKIMTEILEAEFNVMTNIALSGVHRGAVELSQCFSEAMTALDFRFVCDDEMVLVQYDIVNGDDMSENVYYWPSNLDEIFTMCVNSGDYKSIEKLIDEIVTTNLKNMRYSKIVNDYIYYNLLGSFLRITSKIMNYRSIEKMEYHKDMTLEENINIIKEQFKEICSISANKSPENLKLLNRIEEYINDHFCENSLDLIQIADNMQVSVQYLASYFKKNKNTTLLKYITQKRMDYAKELLHKTSSTINDIAVMVGYTDASVFTKVFKKNENITPGKYRAAMSGKNEN